eukprot:NODE_2748_length_510_cov_139.986945_g2698_i0.p1 GENE.NODE_2748_length_510_cov_139.986945_g2698_i0~~NODE_2748_length_510_cov_139.986945_g2698_i0.p1  ORF type:complete len:126 (-),score=33.51 NODE_2748_length_510_cov_139.986945_g2698_i0:72-449(-)
MGRIKAAELQTKKKTEILTQLDGFKQELAQLRVAKQTGGAASKLAKIKVVRKSIARCLTVLNMKQKENLRKVYRGKKLKPLDLRPKQTRAQRRQLGSHEKKIKMVKRAKQDAAFPRQRYYLKAAA